MAVLLKGGCVCSTVGEGGAHMTQLINNNKWFAFPSRTLSSWNCSQTFVHF